MPWRKPEEAERVSRAGLAAGFPRSAVIAAEAEKWITLLLQHFLI